MGSLPGDVAVFASLRSWRAARGQMKPPRRPGKSGAFPPESQRQRNVRGGRPRPANQRERKGSSLHLCSGSEVKFPYLCWLLEERRYLCLFWLNLFFFLTTLLINLFGQPIRSTTEQPKHLHVPWPAACFKAFYFWEHANILLWWIEMLRYGTLPSSAALWKDDLRLWDLYKHSGRLAEGAYPRWIWPALTSSQLKFKVFSNPPPPFHSPTPSWPWALTPVMLYKCHASWERRLSQRRLKRAPIVWGRGLQEHWFFTDGGSENEMPLVGIVFFFHKFIFKFLCRTLHPKKGKKPSEMLCVFVIHSLNVEIPGHQSC